MWPARTNAAELQCEYCGYLLRGLSSHGRCPECGSLIRYTLEARRRRLLGQTPAHSRMLLHVAIAYALVNISAGVFAAGDLLPSFVIFAPVLIGCAVLAAQYVNAPRPFHGWALGAFLGFLAFAGLASGVALACV